MNFYSNNEQETKEIAKKMAAFLEEGDLILLEGNLGVGKTHFVKGIAEAFGYQPDVISPTFNIANFYPTNKATLLHLDLYRIKDIQEFNNLGLFEYLQESITLVEWGKKFGIDLGDFILIEIEYIEREKNKRKLTISHQGETYATKFKKIKEKLNK